MSKENRVINGRTFEFLVVSQGEVVPEGYQLFDIQGSKAYFWIPEPIADSYLYNIVYMFWTGDNEITPNRRESILRFRQLSGCPVVLITNKDLAQFVPDLHPAYYNLSLVHRSDYLRTYFMHHYGGGYSDVKQTTGSWVQMFEHLRNTDLLGIGYREVGPDGCAVIREDPDLTKTLRENWFKLVGNGCYLFKPKTDLTTDWYNELVRVLDAKTEALALNPAKTPRDQDPSYPVYWSEILGNIFHPLCLKYYPRIGNMLHFPICCNYQ